MCVLLAAGCVATDDLGVVENEVGPPTDFVAHWKLNETSGTTATDTSANAQHLTLAGNATWTTSGKLNGALQLDGVDDYASRAAPAAALKPTSAVAVSAWFKTTTTDSAGSEIVSMGDSYCVRVNTDGNLRFFIYSAGVWSRSTPRA